MRSIETNYILPRTETDHHVKYKIPDTRTRDEREYYREIGIVFDHQKAIYVPPSPSDTEETILARKFYQSCYVQPTLLRESGPHKCSVNEFIDEVVLTHQGDSRNVFRYLLGDVGVGKTAFINYLLTTQLQMHIERGAIWFVRLDIHEACHGQIQDLPFICKRFARQIGRVIDKNPEIVKGNEPQRVWGEFRHLLDNEFNLQQENEIGKLRVAMIDLCKSILLSPSHRRLWLILDNMDFLCHLHDRGMFAWDSDTGDRPFLLSIHDFVGHFSHGGMFDDLAANILIVTRFDSYDIIISGDTTDRFPKKENSTYYTIKTPRWQDVFEGRRHLLKFAVGRQNLPGKTKKFYKITALIKRHMTKAYDETETLAHHMLNLSNKGMRDFMLFFSQYAWIGDKDLGPRLIHKVPVGLVTYMLGCPDAYRRFSQMRSKFPNIWLVNIEQGEDARNDDPYSIEHEHPHTYWLKWLIAALIGRDLPYAGPDYVRIFVGQSGDGYGEKEIRKCLGSLCEANLSNMAHAHRGRNPMDNEKLRIDRVQLTPRGRHCMKAVFHRFFYLQLVVDDYLLPLPRCIRDDFLFLDSTPDYSYVTASTNKEYWHGAKQMINLKAHQVVLFLNTLKAALEIERELHSSIFKRLEIDGVYPPDIKIMRDNVVEEIRLLSSRHDSFVDVKTLVEHAAERDSEIYEQLFDMYTIN